ncbi:hypothetical protein HOB87_00605 [Candidatus Woesearchaeota archaeon]|jgi:hypothetical protein|nr:hypothetical protein [Candidatus Woesearchaeota archaeon]
MNIKNNYLPIIIAVTLIVKVVLLILYADFSSMNPDEERNFTIAKNFLDGKGYTVDGKLTAFHGSFTVMLYKWIIVNDIKKEFYIALVHAASLLSFVFSILFFYKILLLAKVSKRASLLATLIYCIYPSNLLYIGNIFLYEKFVLPLMIVTLFILLDLVKNSNKSYIFFVPIIVTLSSLFRAHMIFIYFIIFIIFLLYSLRSNSDIRNFKRLLIISIITAITLIITHIPFLQKNHEMFGSYVISTEAGYVFMFGHNDMARGAWPGNPDTGEYSYNDYSKDVIQDLDKLNEAEEGVARGKYALGWIKSNPLKEFELIARKIAIFMLPKNFLSGYNPLNIIVHALFLISIIIAIREKKVDSITLLFASPFIASLLLSLIFFVDFRWRYFSEPSFILIASYQLWKYKPNKRSIFKK